MVIAEQQVYDYIYCPAFYEMRYKRGIAIDDRLTMPALLEKMVKYFCVNLLNKRLCSISEMQKKWDSMCKEYAHVIDNKKKVIDGMRFIIKFVKWASNVQLQIADIETQYSFLIDKYEFVGNLGIISPTQKGNYEILVPNFSSRIATQLQLNAKLKYAFDAYGFQSVYGREIDGIKVLLVRHDREMYTRRDKQDFDRLTLSLYNIAKGIENNIFYPREGIDCQNCTAQEYCRYWYPDMKEV